MILGLIGYYKKQVPLQKNRAVLFQSNIYKDKHFLKKRAFMILTNIENENQEKGYIIGFEEKNALNR